MFEYFPNNYSWNQSMAIALLLGGNIHEIDEVCRTFKDKDKEMGSVGQEAWYEAWEKLADRAERLAVQDEEAGHYLSAGRKYLNATNYHMLAERHITNLDPRKMEAYEKALHTFQKGIELGREPVERVEIPYQNSSLPALFIPSIVSGRAPCMVFFNGGDSLKEMLFTVVGHEFRRRGMALLIVDNPGAGEALRLRNLFLIPETEVPAAASVDYLEGRPDVDPERIGIMGLSLGGYHAPRSAALEKRFKCCVAWGAAWTFGDFATAIAKGEAASVAPLAFQLAWMFGKETPKEAAEIAQKMTLEGLADKITCPLLVLHGENDQVSPLWQAKKTVEAAVNSEKRDLKIFTRAEGGVEHCQVDNNQLAIELITDWVADTLGGHPEGSWT